MCNGSFMPMSSFLLGCVNVVAAVLLLFGSIVSLSFLAGWALSGVVG